MDADIKDVRVEKIDEVYYGDVIGCAVNVEGAGRCTTFDCGSREIKVCRAETNANRARRFAERLSEFEGPC